MTIVTIKKWLATTPEATALKVALGAALGAIASYIATADVHPLTVAICAAVIPVIVNWLNQDDPRYGRGSAPHYQDQANGPEFFIEGEDGR